MKTPKNRKISASSKKNKKKSTSISQCKRKIKSFQLIIQETIIYIQKYKSMDIIDAASLNVCTQSLENLFKDAEKLNESLNNNKKMIDFEDIANRLQKINDELSINFRSYGTKSMENLLTVVFGNNYIEQLSVENKHLFNLNLFNAIFEI